MRLDRESDAYRAAVDSAMSSYARVLREGHDAREGFDQAEAERRQRADQAAHDRAARADFRRRSRERGHPFRPRTDSPSEPAAYTPHTEET